MTNFPAANDFPISQTEVYVFSAAIAFAAFALFGLLAWEFCRRRPGAKVLPAMVGAAILAIAMGIFIEYHVVVVNSHAPLNSVEMMALSGGVIAATAIFLAIILLPIPGYKPAFVRIGLALIVGAGVFAGSSLIAQAIIVRSEAQSFPVGYIVMTRTASPEPDSGPPVVPNGRTAIWFEPNIPKVYTVGQSEVLTVDVHAQTSPVSRESANPSYDDFLAASGSTVPRCTLKLSATLAAPDFDQVPVAVDPIILHPNENNVAKWVWILTPKTDGLQLLYVYAGWQDASPKGKCPKSFAAPIAYDRFEHVQVKPAFLTVSGIPQWLALIATIVGILSTTFGMFKRPD